MRTLALSLFALSLSACTSASGESRDLKILRDYRSWTKAAPQAQLMPARLAVLCSAPIDFKKQTGETPHEPAYAQTYISAEGRIEFLEKTHPKFPRGTILVKEKITGRDNGPPDLLTIMIKREAGFAPKTGDWEYLAYDGKTKRFTSHEKLGSCMKCHESKSADDYVFRDMGFVKFPLREPEPKS